MGGAAQLLSPAKRRRAVEHVRGVLGRDRLSERRACRVLGQHRNTQRRQRHVPDDEPRLVTRIVWLACEYGRYGYRRITALLHWEGWRVNHKRVERIWRDEGLKVPKKQPKRRRLWFNNGSCIRLRPTHRNHVWSYCLVADRTSDGRPIRMLTAGSHGRVHSGVPGDRWSQAAHERGRAGTSERSVRPYGCPGTHP